MGTAASSCLCTRVKTRGSRQYDILPKSVRVAVHPAHQLPQASPFTISRWHVVFRAAADRRMTPSDEIQQNVAPVCSDQNHQSNFDGLGHYRLPYSGMRNQPAPQSANDFFLIRNHQQRYSCALNQQAWVPERFSSSITKLPPKMVSSFSDG